ncbi:MAG: PilZ domain-containing protein [Pyrinomonadaceae bacterium]|nr:PilZ domain-containing protein [Pyrinomonadaceae bacterium]
MIRKERRRAKRISTNLTVSWNTLDFSQDSKITDLSTEGCFVLTANRMSVNKLSRVTQVPKKDAIHLELHLSHDERLKLDGEVVYEIERLGFGVRFLNVTTPAEHLLGAFIDKQDLEREEALPFPRVRGHKH